MNYTDSNDIQRDNSKDSTDAFYELLDDVSQYAIDNLGKEMSEDAFFSDLYVYRKQVHQVQKLLEDKNRHIVIVGARGSGKTTIARKFVRDEQKNNDDKSHFVIYINIRTDPEVSVITDMLETSPPKDIKHKFQQALTDTRNLLRVGSNPNYTENITNIALTQRLLNKIQNEYKNKFPIHSTKGKSIGRYYLKVFKYIYDPNNQTRHELFSEFSSFRDELCMMFARQCEGFDKVDFGEWIQESWRREDRLSHLLIATREQLRVQHWVFLANEILGINKQTIWIDNIDTLTGYIQSHVHSALTILFSMVKPWASVLVSVREQNVYKDFDAAEFGSTTTTSFVTLPTVMVSDRALPAFNIVPFSEKEVDAIIVKRLRYILKHGNTLTGGKLIFNKYEINKLISLSTTIKKVCYY